MTERPPAAAPGPAPEGVPGPAPAPDAPARTALPGTPARTATGPLATTPTPTRPWAKAPPTTGPLAIPSPTTGLTPTAPLRCGPYVVDRERIAAFAAALGDPHPAYTDPAAARALGHRDTIAPPTYLTTLAARAEDQLLGSRPGFTTLDGAVHRSQSVRHARPAHAGDTLHATVRVADVTTLAGRQLLTLDCEFHDADGLWVATTTSALLCPDAPGTLPARPRPSGEDALARRPLDPTGSEHP